MGKRKPATDLLDNPQFTEESQIFESEIEDETSLDEGTPFDKGYDMLTATGGKKLELMTRSTKRLAKALDVGYTLMFNYKSPYIRGRLDMMMRTRVALGGKGRAEMVQSVQAGSGVPGEYYDKPDNSYKAFLDPERDGNEDID